MQKKSKCGHICLARALHDGGARTLADLILLARPSMFIA